jgi:hypothetical protein
MAVIVTLPKFRVAVLAGAVGYATMILVMTATPLAMRAQGFEMSQIAFIMQWHVLGMFAPSFVTGSLIARFGVQRILLSERRCSSARYWSPISVPAWRTSG